MRDIICISLVLILGMLMCSIVFINKHEGVHDSIARDYGCSIEKRVGIVDGHVMSTCRNISYVERMQMLELQGWTEIIGYHLCAFMFMFYTCFSVFVLMGVLYAKRRGM